MKYKRKFWIKEVKEEKTEGGKQGKEIILTLLFITADCCLSDVFCVRFNTRISSWMASEVGLFKGQTEMRRIFPRLNACKSIRDS